MLRNTVERAEKARKKKAALGQDIDIEEFEGEEAGEHEEIESLNELSKKDQKSLLKVGVDRIRGRKIWFISTNRPIKSLQ